MTLVSLTRTKSLAAVVPILQTFGNTSHRDSEHARPISMIFFAHTTSWGCKTNPCKLLHVEVLEIPTLRQNLRSRSMATSNSAMSRLWYLLGFFQYILVVPGITVTVGYALKNTQAHRPQALRKIFILIDRDTSSDFFYYVVEGYVIIITNLYSIGTGLILSLSNRVS